MEVALWLLAAQGAIGAFDTLYYHEWRARLPVRGAAAAPELRLHAGRDLLYAVLFATLPWLAWQGTWSFVLAAVILSEIVLTLWDFVTEVAVRRSFGGVLAGERVTHAIMGILYGAMLACLLPDLWGWAAEPTGLRPAPPDVPEPLRWCLLVMAVGVFASGMRDLAASLGLPSAAWPWRPDDANAPGAR